MQGGSSSGPVWDRRKGAMRMEAAGSFCSTRYLLAVVGLSSSLVESVYDAERNSPPPGHKPDISEPLQCWMSLLIHTPPVLTKIISFCK